jgi:hypothetical protein
MGVQISREVIAANGSLDFHCSYTKDDKLMKVCIEMKNAHHEQLLHGLTKQLPAYLDGEATQDGIFLVLWYKGDRFARPTGFTTSDELFKHLETNIPSKYRIRIMIIDCAEKTWPSWLK